MKRIRRSVVKQGGKHALRRLGAVMARQSMVDDRPVFEAAAFDWASRLEANWRPIRAELDRVLTCAAAIPSFHEVSPDQERISVGDNWKTFVLFGFGYKIAENCRTCPETTRILETIPGLRTAFFSILAPGYRIPSHRGVTKGVLRGHLGLIVPAERDDCWMRIGTERRIWREGECLVFDDTFEHEVHNDTPERRVVLLVDVDRPMRFWGRQINRALMAGIRGSAYVQDARRNLRSSEQKFAAACADAGAGPADRNERPEP